MEEPRWVQYVWYECKVPNVVALTFDDGPGNNTEGIIDKLNELGVKGTFFVNGKTHMDITRPSETSLVKKAFNTGHQIASHTFSHHDLRRLNAMEIKNEMNLLNDVLYDIIGVRPQYMRPPYGRLNDLAFNVLNDLNYKIIIWNVDTNDWKHPTDSDASFQSYFNAMKSAPKDASFIGLQHDIHAATNAAYVERVVRYAESLGKKIVRMDECLGAPGTAYTT
ncbi:hypothetical protein BDF19DRAFT_451444 [Syncephalis fuscata]|nr:hypothetical protein BDF19DRAFT_451444 [Syncephalis fuscata]